MRVLIRQSGTTIVELVIYIGLLAFIARLFFSFALQVNSNNKKIISSHIAMGYLQLAQDLIVQDIQKSRAIKLFKNEPVKLFCEIDDTAVEWKIDKKTLFKVYKKEAKRLAVSKVADNIEGLKLLRTVDKHGQEIVSVQLLATKESLMPKLVTRRNTMLL